MAFMRSLFSGVSGLRNHQIMMDVIGNNIANINTIGFKASRTTFSDSFSQLLHGASSPTADNGGTNPMQVGLGSAVATIDSVFSQGNIETTSNVTDLAIQGDGFFAVNKGGKTLYTRVGSFSFDAEGRLVNSGNKAIVQGKIAAPDGTLPTGTALQDLKIAQDQKSPAKATTKASFTGNLSASSGVGSISLKGNIDSGTAVGGSVGPTNVTVTDSFGTAHTVGVTLTKTAANTWSYALSSTAGAVAGGAGTIVFDGTGAVQSITPANFTLTPAGGAPPLAFTLKDISMTQIASSNSLASEEADPANASCSVTVYDSLGNQHVLSLQFAKTSTTNVWSWTASVGTPATITGGRTGQISFDGNGNLASFTYDDGSQGVAIAPGGGALSLSVALDAGTAGVFAGITQSGAASSVSNQSQDGYAAGDLTSLSIDQSGRIIGSFSNSTQITMGQVMLAEFTNPNGLERAGDNLYDVTGNAGTPVITTAGGSSRSSIVSSALEQSNVDLAEEFTKMITAQRGFQANARVITTSDEFLQEVVGLKR